MNLLSKKLTKQLKNEGIAAFVFEEVTTTFDKAKELIKDFPCGVVIAKRQTAGRGKGERKFISPEGGVYFTIFYKNMPIEPTDTLKTVINAGYGIYLQLKQLGFDAKLKWPNDVLIGGKKACGILTEIFTRQGGCDFFCGVGVNVNTKDFGEFNGIATSLYLSGGKIFDINEIAVKLVLTVNKWLFDESDLNIKFLTASGMKGKTVKVTNGSEEYFCTVKSLSPDGFLIAERDGREIKIISGDVKEV